MGFPTPPEPTLKGTQPLHFERFTPINLQMRANAQVNNLQEYKLAVQHGGPFPLHTLLRRQRLPQYQLSAVQEGEEESEEGVVSCLLLCVV